MGYLERNNGETREHWEDQEIKINSLGTIREIVNNKELLLEIITYYGDRHLIGKFYDMLNKAIEMGEVTPEDLTHLRSGWLGNCLVNLDTTVREAGRDPYPFEKGDKLNYTTTIKDVETQIATFTNPKIIDAFAGNVHDRELSYCEQSLSYLSFEAQLRIIQEVIKAGNVEKGMQMMAELTQNLERSRKYAEEDRNLENRGR